MGKTRTDTVPVEVYIQFVRSLFDNAHMVLIGAACHALIAFMVYWRNGEPVFAVLAGILLLIGIWRYLGMRRFHREGAIDDAASAVRWEREYIIKGSLQGLALGFFCFISIYVYSDPFAEIGAVAVTLGSIVTVVGRNYGSPRMVMIFAVTFVGPIAAGLILRLDIPHVVLGLLIVPLHVHHQGQRRQCPPGAVLGRRRAPAGAADRPALRPRAEHDVAWPGDDRPARQGHRLQCGSRASPVRLPRPTRCSAARSTAC